MTSPLTRQLRLKLTAGAGTVLLVVSLLLSVFSPVQAQTGQQLSVSPALFEIGVVPGQSWQSAIKVVNGNSYPLTIYVEPVNFAPRGEGGDGSLLPVLETEREGITVAEWIELEQTAYEVPAQSSVGVAFNLRVPEDAPPGGHFAAFMVGTRPPATEGRSELRTAQVITSLFFVRVAGDVVEQGSIREFRPAQWFRSRPEVTLELRFENTGNVHLRPQGDVRITNMWGQERGVIPINRQGHFGNVLPESVRKFSFTWRGEKALSDMGRYRAEVTLAYGTDARQFATSVTYFWVVPVVPVITALVVIVTTLLLIVWLVRLYVRSLLSRAGFGPRYHRPYVRDAARRGALIIEGPPPVITTEAVVSRKSVSLAGVVTGFSLLRQKVVNLYRLVVSNERLAPLAWVAVFMLLTIISVFIYFAVTGQRSYEVAYEDGAGRVVSSDEIMYRSERQVEAGLAPDGAPSVRIVNESGVAGAAATVALMLETQDYHISEVTTTLDAKRGKTVVVIASDADTEFGLRLARDLGGAMLSTFGDTASSTDGVTAVVYLGSDIAGKTEGE